MNPSSLLLCRTIDRVVDGEPFIIRKEGNGVEGDCFCVGEIFFKVFVFGGQLPYSDVGEAVTEEFDDRGECSFLSGGVVVEEEPYPLHGVPVRGEGVELNAAQLIGATGEHIWYPPDAGKEGVEDPLDDRHLCGRLEVDERNLGVLREAIFGLVGLVLDEAPDEAGNGTVLVVRDDEPVVGREEFGRNERERRDLFGRMIGRQGCFQFFEPRMIPDAGGADLFVAPVACLPEVMERRVVGYIVERLDARFLRGAQEERRVAGIAGVGVEGDAGEAGKVREGLLLAVAVTGRGPVPEALLVAAAVLAVADDDVGVEVEEGFPLSAAGTGEDEMVAGALGIEFGEECRAIDPLVDVFEQGLHRSSNPGAV